MDKEIFEKMIVIRHNEKRFIEADDILYNHLVVEFSVHNRAVLESNGNVPKMSEFVLDFLDNAVSPLFDRMLDNNDTIAYQDFDKFIFTHVTELFFTNIDIRLTIGVSDDVTYSGFYDPIRSVYYDNIFVPRIDITATAPTKDKLIDVLRGAFAHEMTHAYDDWKRSSKYNTIGSKMHRDAIDNHYYNTINLTGTSFNQNVVCGMVNILSKIELNAVIGQFKSELEPYVDKIDDIHSAYEYAKKTRAWKKYETLKNNIDYVLSLKNDDIGKTVLKNFNLVTEKNFKNLGKLKRFLREIFCRWEHKFINTTSKTLYELYSSRGEYVIK